MSNQNIDFGGVLKDVHNPTDHALQVDVINGAGTPIPVVLTAGTVLYTIQVDFTDIPNSGGSLFVVQASTVGEISKVIPYDTTGVPIGLYVNGSLVLRMGPGYDVPTDIIIASGSSVAIRGLSAQNPVAGVFYISLIGV